MEEFKKIFLENINKYPERIREALLSFDNAILLKEIIQENNLNQKQGDIFLEEVGYVLIGAIQPKEFAQRIKERLNIDPTKAGNIFRKTNKEIFINLTEEISKASQISQEIGLDKIIPKLKESTSKEEPKAKQQKDKKKIVNLKPLTKKQEPTKNKINLTQKPETLKREIKPKNIISLTESGNKQKKEDKKIKTSTKNTNQKSESVEPFSNIVSFQRDQTPISKIEKPLSFNKDQLEQTQESASFGKIEFPNQNQIKAANSQKTQPTKPKFKTIEYSQPKEDNEDKTKFKNIIKLKK